MPGNNKYGSCVVLTDANGICIDNTRCQILAANVGSALVGSLTITGVANLNGSLAAWVIPATSVGVFTPPGDSGGIAGLPVTFVYSNPGADAGKVTLAYIPR